MTENNGNIYTNGTYTYPSTYYYDSSETETTVTETFYDEQGRVVREVVTVTKTKPRSYTNPYQPYIYNIDVKSNPYDYKATFKTKTN